MRIFVLVLFLMLNVAFASEFKESFFVSLRSNEINLRTGPGNEYPIKYIYQLKNLPLKVVGEYDNWYKTQDKDSDDGWINKNLVIKKRTLIVINGTQICYKKNNLRSSPIFRIEENVIVGFEKCIENWCKVHINNEKCWLESKNVWGYEI